MLLLKNVLALLVISLSYTLLVAQDSTQLVPLKSLQAFYGQWEGTLHIIKETDTLQSVPMSLHIEYNEDEKNIKWNTTYSGEKPVSKPYIVEAGETPGTYLLDEGNSIKIPHYLNGNVFSSFYKVMGRYFMVENLLINETEMLFSIKVIPEKPELISGGIKTTEQEIPEVASHGISMLQLAKLKRVK